MDTFYCYGCQRRRSVEALAPTPAGRRVLRNGKAGPPRKHCTECAAKKTRPRLSPDDVVKTFPDGRPMLRKHVLERNHRRAQKHYRDGSAFKGWS